MTSTSPTKEQLISLVESMCEVQDRMLGARGMPEHIQRPHVDNIEALKAPVFFLFELLGYGTARELSEKGVKRVWMASFRSSPGEYLEECLSLLRDYKVPISEYDGGTRLRVHLKLKDGTFNHSTFCHALTKNRLFQYHMET